MSDVRHDNYDGGRVTIITGSFYCRRNAHLYPVSWCVSAVPFVLVDGVMQLDKGKFLVGT